MTFLKQFQAHKGGLLKIKTRLYWSNKGRHDGNPGRVCLILDVYAARQVDNRDIAAAGAANEQAERDGKKVISILIDDREKAKQAWEENGGVFILYDDSNMMIII
jgi:hypothetical protein